MSHSKLTLLFDGGCPICRREVNFLRSRDHSMRIKFVDIDLPNYRPEIYGGISYREAMGRLHALTAEGYVLKDVLVLQVAYDLVGLGWFYAPTKWPIFAGFAAFFYRLWAGSRLSFTLRPSLEELCRSREIITADEEEAIP